MDFLLNCWPSVARIPWKEIWDNYLPFWFSTPIYPKVMTSQWPQGRGVHQNIPWHFHDSSRLEVRKPFWCLGTLINNEPRNSWRGWSYVPSHIFLLILKQSDIKYSKIRMQLPLISFLNFLSCFITTFVAVGDRNDKYVQYFWFLSCLAFYFTFSFSGWPMVQKVD